MKDVRTLTEIGSNVRLLRRGGANNKRDRFSIELNGKQCRRLIEATSKAFDHDVPFNRFMTIAWGKCGLELKDSVAATGQWIALARNWARAQGYRLSWAWVQEFGPKMGAHCHALLHVPPGLDHVYRNRPTSWARMVLARYDLPYVAGTVDTQRVGPLYLPIDNLSVPDILWRGHVPLDNMDRRTAYMLGVLPKVHYMLKCASEELEYQLGLTDIGYKTWGRVSAVTGKRLGTWQFPKG